MGAYQSCLPILANWNSIIVNWRLMVSKLTCAKLNFHILLCNIQTTTLQRHANNPATLKHSFSASKDPFRWRPSSGSQQSNTIYIEHHLAVDKYQIPCLRWDKHTQTIKHKTSRLLNLLQLSTCYPFHRIGSDPCIVRLLVTKRNKWLGFLKVWEEWYTSVHH